MSANEIERFRGDTYPIVVTIKENSNAVDLTGCTVKMTIGYSTPVTVTGSITDAVNGIVQFNFTESDVSKVGRFEYDIQVDTGSIKTTYVRDNFILKSDLTKP